MGSQQGTEVMKICLVLVLFAFVGSTASQSDCCPACCLNLHIPVCHSPRCKSLSCCRHTMAPQILSASPPETVKSIPQDKTVFVHESESSLSSEEAGNTLE